MLQKVGLGLILVGALLLGGWMFRGFFTDPQIPTLIRIAVGTISAGFIILLLALISDRLTKAKQEKDKENPRW